ncbi:MAG: spore germination protein [Clostridia bacterium]|nr:spore germination protein [Clostridia bacterium]
MLDKWRLYKKINPNNPNPPKNKSLNGEISIENIKIIFENSDDIQYREIHFSNETLILIYFQNTIDIELVDNNILRPIMQIESTNCSCLPKDLTESNENNRNSDILSILERGIIPHTSNNIRNNLNDVITDILDCCACLISTKIKDRAITFDIKKIEKRNLTEPTNENIIKGSKEAFIENIKINTSLIRNRIKSADLKIKEFKVGNVTPTSISVLYMESIVDKIVLDKVLSRIKNINIDKMLTIADVEENIVCKKYSVFPQLIYTEKSEKLISNLLEGKIGILIDGFPVAYILPAVLNMFFQTPEDYSVNYFISSALRVLRYFCTVITIILPSFFLAISTFHQEMIPTKLAISIIKSKQGEPFPVLLEVMFMLLSFEILIEASARLPKTIGQTISIVGGLIIGDAAVNANFVSPSVVVIVAITGIAGFLMPNQDFANALRVCRFSLVILSGIAGLYGVSIGIILMFYYLSTMESFGVPYFTPFTSNDYKNINVDTIFRKPMTDMKAKTKVKR